MDGSPQRAAELLAEIHDGRYAQLDDTDRYMVITEVDGTGAHVRYATDEDAIANLIQSGCVQVSGDSTPALHGVIRRPVALLRLTPRGRSVWARWNALAPIGGR